MRPYSDEDLALAWAILKDLSDRAGIPEWLGSEGDDAAREVARAVATLIGQRPEPSLPTGGPADGK